MAWYNASWTNRVKVTVLAAKVDADLTDFPIYVDLSLLPAGFHTNVNQTDGRDIRVTTADGSTEVPREVVFYDSATDKGELHFKGTIANSTDTDFYIYYGNASATEPAANATYGKNNVWSSDFELVAHLNGDPTTSILDSTVNALNGATGGSMTSADVVAGKLGKALDFDGNDYADFGDVCDFRTYDKTFSIWVKTSDTEFYIIAKSAYGPGSGRHALGVAPKPQGFANLGGTDSNPIGANDIDTGWHLIKSVIDRDVGHKTVVDGVAVSTNNGTNVTNYAASDLNNIFHLLLGVYNNTAGTGPHATFGWFVGQACEMRVKKSADSDAYNSTEYNNQSSPSTFFTIGSEETNSTESSSISPSRSPSSSVSPSVSPSSSISASISPSASVSPSESPSLSPSSSVSPSPSPGYQGYTRGNYVVLPTNDADLETAYVAQDYTDVESKNNIRVAQTGTGEYMIHQFKDYVGVATACDLECELQTSLAPSLSTVYLQIYNYDTTSWDTVDTDSTSSVDTDFILTAIIVDLTNYKNPSNVITCRVYQRAL